MIAPEDVIAARRIMGGSANSHEAMNGLPGADMCPHVLAGSGVPVATLADRAGNWDGLDRWIAAPYRHHKYAGIPSVLSGQFECACGNSEANEIHWPICISEEGE